MPQVINTNVSSLNAQRQLNKSQEMQQRTMERLSSGLRINSAKDDAAGLAIADRFTSQIKGINQATRNANDGISMAQTAEGAMGEMNTNLQRLRELSIQSANATNSASDRAALNAEAKQLVAEIGRISEDTEFNGIKLLNGSASSHTFQIGASAGQTFSMAIGKLSIDRLGGGKSATVSAIGGDPASSDTSLHKGDLVINGVTIDGSSGSDDNASTSEASMSAIAKVAAINKSSEKTGVVATVNATVAAGSEQTVPASAANGTITINGVTTDNIAIGTGDAATNRKAVMEAINAMAGQTGVVAVDTGKSETGINLVAADGRNIAISFTGTNMTSATTGVAAADTYHGGFNLTSVNGEDITIEQGTGDISRAGLAEGTYAANVGSVSTTARVSDEAVTGTNDVTTNGFDFNATHVQFDISLSGGDSVTVVLDEATSDATSYAALLQEKINAAVGTGIVTVSAVHDLPGTPDTTSMNIAIMSNERITITNVHDVGSGATTVASSNILEEFQGKSIGGPDALRDGDLVINGVAIQAAKASDDTYSNKVVASSNRAASGIAIAAAINAAAGETGVTAEVQATVVDGGDSSTDSAARAGISGAVFINGESFAMTLTGDAALDRSTALERINSMSGKTGVTAEDTGSGLKLTAADGRNISVVIDSNAAYNTAAVTNGGLGEAAGFAGADIGLSGTGVAEVDVTGVFNGFADTNGGVVGGVVLTDDDYVALANTYAETTTSKITLHSAGQFTVAAGSNGSAELKELGFQVGTFGGSEDSGQFLKDIDISTVEGATKALAAVDSALATINSERGNLGAVQNRLTSTISAQSITSENLAAARSRIQDTDFAAETAELSRVQILQQAGVAMLSQANASTQNVMSLLR